MKSVFLSLLILLFTGCTVNNLSLNDDKKLILSIDKEQNTLSSNILEQSNFVYGPLNVFRYKFQDENGIIFYEEVDINNNYTLKYTLTNTIQYIFATKDMQVVWQNKNLIFAQLELENKLFINIIISSNDAENFSYVYGFSNHEFMNILRATVEDKPSIQRVARQAQTLSLGDLELSRWSSQMLIMNPLTTRLGGRLGL